jgi:DNA repair exonuclease SbcCD nuclease subunit
LIVQDTKRRTVVVSHNTITPSPVPYDHILLKDMPGVNVIYLLGHYHKFFMEAGFGKNAFINTGPIVRTDTTEQGHKPCVMLITIIDGMIKQIKTVYLTSAKQDVFVKEADETSSFDFVNSIKNTTFQYCDLFDLTKQIGKSLNTPKEIVDNAIERLEKIQREIS